MVDKLEETAIIEIFQKKSGKTFSVIIDKDKEEELRKFAWCIQNGYASTSIKRKNIFMHKMLLPGKIIDHIDRNKLNNTMKNLRVSTYKLNALNRNPRKDKISQFRGVTKRNGKFSVSVRNYHVGVFENELSAAYAYDQYIINNFSNDEYIMANLNNIKKPENFQEGKKQPPKKDPDLPKGISYVRDTYFQVRVVFKGLKSKSYTFKTKEDATEKHRELLITLEKKWENTMKNLPITKNKEGIAFLPTSKHCYTLDDTKRKHYEILVDDNQWHMLNKMGQWTINSDGYAIISKDHIDSGRQMHRIIMNCIKGDDNTVDHINNNKIDNRKDNLRILHYTDPLQSHNKYKKEGCTSQYKGVSKIKEGKWLADITYNHKRYSMNFTEEEKAARWYDMKAIELYGINGRFNFPLPDLITKTLLESKNTAINVLQEEKITVEMKNNTEKRYSSQYKGVSRRKKRWRAYISHNKKWYTISLPTEEAAARWYDTKVAEFHGATGHFNFPLPDPITQNLLASVKVLTKRNREDSSDNVDCLEPDNKRSKIL